MKAINFNPVRKLVLKLKTIQADPKNVCYGFAFGIFMCTTPLIGIKWLVALPVLWLTKWNKIACMIGIFQVNSLTGPFYYAVAYFIGSRVCGFGGNFLMPGNLSFSAMKDLFFSSAEVFLSLTIGGLIISIPLTTGAFYLVKSIFSQKTRTQLT
jgi:uncharacterized protein (DUF2062 family)